MTEDHPVLRRVQRWSEKATAATAARNEAIRAARAEGHSLRAVAAASHLSVEAVRRIAQPASL